MNRKKLREGVYIAGLVMETANRVANILGGPEPIKHKLIYGLYKIGRYLRK